MHLRSAVAGLHGLGRAGYDVLATSRRPPGPRGVGRRVAADVAIFPAGAILTCTVPAPAQKPCDKSGLARQGGFGTPELLAAGDTRALSNAFSMLQPAGGRAPPMPAWSAGACRLISSRSSARSGSCGRRILGFAQFDVRSGSEPMLDVNPRLYDSLPLALSCGVHLCTAWRAMATRGPVRRPPHAPGVYYR